MAIKSKIKKIKAKQRDTTVTGNCVYQPVIDQVDENKWT